MTDEERKALMGAMKDQIESWESKDPREGWWKWQHQYARAADQIEADGQRIAELEAALFRLLDFSPAYMWRAADIKAIARAALRETK